jgi:hypothetical protein
MQQLAFRKFQARHTELKPLADAWDEHVRETFKRGHDVQLHIHSQWSDATYEGGIWRLGGDWSILKHEPERAREMLRGGKEYLENLLRPVDPSYRCVAFRAGSSVIAPSPFILSLLADLGIVFDLSIIGGMSADTKNLRFDYRNCEESLVPYYPRMDDARRVSGKREPIVCVPLFHFYGSRRRVFAQTVSLALGKAREKLSRRGTNAGNDDGGYAGQEWMEARHASTLLRVYDKAIKPCLKGKHLTADLSRLSYPFLREMLRDIRRRAAASGLSEMPVILTNHTKYVEDFAPIERFLGDAAASEDIKFLTLSALASKIQSGQFQVKIAASRDRPVF